MCTKCLLSSVRYYGTKLWNELDKPLKESISLKVLKKSFNLGWPNLFLFDMQIMCFKTIVIRFKCMVLYFFNICLMIIIYHFHLFFIVTIISLTSSHSVPSVSCR